MIRLSDYVIDFVAKQGVKHIFMVAGGGAMFLVDSLGKRKDIGYICNHHEQASAMSAEGYQRVTANLGAGLVSTGPAGTNTVTGVLCSWNDSIPILFISGQANSRCLIGNTGLRQLGTHEADIIKIVGSVTKYAVTVTDEKTIRYHLEKAVFLARSGRPGPVWVDIPIDMQGKIIDENSLASFSPEREKIEARPVLDSSKVSAVAEILQKAERPIIIAGHGIRLSSAQQRFIDFIEKYHIPVVTTKNGFDLLYESHKLLAGRIGTYGQRAGNFAVQNSDLVLAMGTRLPFTVVGYQTQWFAREAKKIVVDIDPVQLEHSTIKIDISVNADLRDFIPELDRALNGKPLRTEPWIERCARWRVKYPSVLPEWKAQKEYVNPYYFFEVLSEELGDDDIVVTDQGAAFYCSTAAFKLKQGQRLFTNGGFSPMGYGLPAAIGACLGSDRKKVICVHGDGGLQLNIQELQTIVHYKLPIKLFIFNNQGYLSIKNMQLQYFDGFLVGADPKSGVSCPDTLRIADAYHIPSRKIENHIHIRKQIKEAINSEGPTIVDIILHPLQPFMPRVISERKPDGKLISKPLEDMWPFLAREEFLREMIVKPVEEN